MAQQVGVCRFLQGVGTQSFEMYGNQDTRGRVFKATSRPDTALQARDRICYHLMPFFTLSRSACRGFDTGRILCCFSTFGTDIHRWQRRCDQLTQLQRRIRFPPPEKIVTKGQVYELPLASVEPMRPPRQEELEYLVGFFDGDGCVSLDKHTGAVQLAICQNIDSAEVLLLFRSMLGGSIGRQSAAAGSKKAKVQWRVYSSRMTAAAAALSTVPSMKQAQLLIAKQGCIAENDRARVGECLKTFKQRQHVPDRWSECSWPYFAGFFDAEGSISVHPSCAALQLRLNQVNPCMPLELLRFLHENQLPRWSLCHYASHSSLACQSLEDCKQTLKLLLENGLLVKRKQAELALSLTAENHLQIRDAISSLSGLQGRYQRLDTDGIARAREIHRVQKKLQRLDGPEHAALHSQLEKMCAEHKLQKLISQCDLLRKDMRQSLRQGGRVVSQTSGSS